MLAFSRILNDEEGVFVANTNTQPGQDQSVDVIVDGTLNQAGDTYEILFSNKGNPTAPGSFRQTGSVTVREVDGSISNGSLIVVRVTLEPMEAQILGR